MFKTMDYGSYEKLSIRESARALKKYGSTSKHVNKNENYIKHYITNSDTLQGIALKYDVTIEQIRRVNRLWASDSLFLKEYLLIPTSSNSNSSSFSSCQSNESTPVVSPTQSTTPPPPQSSSSSISSTTNNNNINNTNFDDENIDEFLEKIDASIASTKEEVKKVQDHSEFASGLNCEIGRRKPIARMKQTVINNNSTNDSYQYLHQPTSTQAVVVQQGRKVKSSLRHLERQQDELFEL